MVDPPPKRGIYFPPRKVARMKPSNRLKPLLSALALGSLLLVACGKGGESGTTTTTVEPLNEQTMPTYSVLADLDQVSAQLDIINEYNNQTGRYTRQEAIRAAELGKELSLNFAAKYSAYPFRVDTRGVVYSVRNDNEARYYRVDGHVRSFRSMAGSFQTLIDSLSDPRMPRAYSPLIEEIERAAAEIL